MMTASTTKIRMTDRYSGREAGQPFAEAELITTINGEEINIGTLETEYTNDNAEGRWQVSGYEFKAFDDRFEDDFEVRLYGEKAHESRKRLLHRLSLIAGALND